MAERERLIPAIPTVEEVRVRVKETRDRLKTRIAEWKERGWRASETRPRLQIVKEIREKGVLSALKARREKRLRGQVISRKPEEVEPAFPKARAVREAAEITPTVGRREIAIEI